MRMSDGSEALRVRAYKAALHHSFDEKAFDRYLAEHGNTQVLCKLEKAGCDKRLMALLIAQLLRTKTLRPTRRETVSDAAKACRKTAKAVQRLSESSVGPLLGPPLAEFTAQLTQFEGAFNQLTAQVHGRESVIQKGTLAALISYVKIATKQFHDGEMTSLLEPIMGSAWSASRWRRDHKDLIGKSLARVEDYWAWAAQTATFQRWWHWGSKGGLPPFTSFVGNRPYRPFRK